jgi:hypothetical protein
MHPCIHDYHLVEWYKGKVTNTLPTPPQILIAPVQVTAESDKKKPSFILTDYDTECVWNV